MRYLFLLVVITLSSCMGVQHKEKPNVLFIIADDLTAQTVSSYENKACKTPNIDKLADEGVRYTAAYCQFPICGPSRASFMSGYYPSATQSYGYISGRENIGPDRLTWSQLFKQNGYYTARVSKIFHMGVPIDIEKGSNGSDDEASWDERYNSQGPEWTAKGEGELVQNNPDGTLGVKGGNVMTIVKADGDDLVHADGKTAQKACELIRQHKNEPFFLAVGFVRPHVPFVAPKSYFDPYPFEGIQLPEKVENDWDDIPRKGINYVTTVNAEMSEEQQQKAIAAYYASVSYMDAQVGKVLKTLKEEGLEDNTIVIFTSDHGFHLGEHDFWMKVSLKEESIRVPLIIKVPGKKPAVCHSFAELIDLYPTLAELAGLDYSKHLQGKSLVKTLDDPAHEVRDMAFSMSKWYGTFFYTLRSKKWSYAQYGETGTQGVELFDMVKDPKQFNNLANDPEYADVVADMKEKLQKKLAEVRNNDLGKDYTADKKE